LLGEPAILLDKNLLSNAAWKLAVKWTCIFYTTATKKTSGVLVKLPLKWDCNVAFEDRLHEDLKCCLENSPEERQQCFLETTIWSACDGT
jgi:hypothetical protein